MEFFQEAPVGIWLGLLLTVVLALGLMSLFRPLIRGVMIASRLKVVAYLAGGRLGALVRLISSGLPRVGT